jgi:hypothetical protein
VDTKKVELLGHHYFSVLNLLLGAPAAVMAPTATLQAGVVVTEVVAALLIMLVVFPGLRQALTAR